MLEEPMMEKLTTMRLLGMVDALKAQEQDPAAREQSFLERLGLLVDHQWTWRENQALARRLYVAKLKGGPTIESCEQTGHRRMITSALASAQSAFSLRCAAESGIKTIVQMGSALGVVTVPRSYPERSLRPFQKSLLEKHIEFCATPATCTTSRQVLAG
jgi:hypothetical protein